MDDTPEPAVEAIGLHKEFGDVVAVDHLDLRVEAGSFFGFLGPNGAGKSTTIKILTGMILPTSGKAAILGHDIVDDAVAAKQITGVVSEDGALFERLTGAEYLEFVGRMYGMERQTIRERSNELLELMDLAADRAKLIVDYSHGMQKKLGFAAALIHNPKVLFLDEPFEGIDAVTGRNPDDDRVSPPRCHPWGNRGLRRSHVETARSPTGPRPRDIRSRRLRL
jgi:ABC-2 type transport system ATP-binding protein